MPAIRHRKCEAMLACVARLHECAHTDQFARVVLEEIPKLVGSDHSTFNYVAPTVPYARVLASPEGPNHEERERTFARYAAEHPLLKHYLATGDGSAFMISDFLSQRAYHALELYQNFYRELRYEDQIAIFLFPPASEIIGIALNRDRRSFTGREREILNLLRPHIARAYWHVERTSLLKRGLDPREQTHTAPHVTSVLLDAQDRPVRFGPQAQRWISRFFPGRPRDPSRLPAEVTDWLYRTRQTGPGQGTAADGCNILERDREGQRLQLRVGSDPSTSERILVLGLETTPAAAHSTLAGRLTRREIEVLLQVEQGKTNVEVAAALGLSPLTVRYHLEHIFEKLHASSRTGAVTVFRRMTCGEWGSYPG